MLKGNATIEELQEEARHNLMELADMEELDAEDADPGADAEEEKEDDDADGDEETTTDAPESTPAVGAAAEETGEATKTPSTASSINDDDAKCYSSRYQDIDALLDPKQHFSTVGIQQGRLGTCAKRLTDYEAQRYLYQNPDLQRMFGKTGASSLAQAREHWQATGYKNTALAASIVDKDNIPFKCASGPQESCMCPGTLWFGLSTRPDN